MSLSVRNCLVVRNPQEMLLWDSKLLYAMGLQKSLESVEKRIKEDSRKHSLKFGRDITHLSEEKIFEGYIGKFYNIRECEKFYFGNNASPSTNSSQKTRKKMFGKIA